jgi:hypothetical protein
MIDNHQNIILSLNFLKEVIDDRIKNFLAGNPSEVSFRIPDLQIAPSTSPLNDFLIQHQISIEEYLILLLALAPHIQPNFLNTIVQKHLPNGGDFVEIGGVKGESHRGTLPTGETALFLLAGTDIAERIRVSEYFSEEHFFRQNDVLRLEGVKEGEPRMSGKLVLSPELVELFTIGRVSAPAFSPDFPAKKIATEMTWEDLVLRDQTYAQIDDIKIWLEYHPLLEKDTVIHRKLKPGYRALFYGPSGTGKTLTASLLGKHFGKDVYRIDLSQVVSKYIGETEKNLEKVFSKAENKDWILFFDEADALFGKRSNVSSAHDKYANQEVSYLLQRVEDYRGLIILASNFKNNIDPAFVRRFNAIVHFPPPDRPERLMLWKKNVPASIPLANGLNFEVLAHKYELTGSGITNVMQYASLRAISRNGKKAIDAEDILSGIKREFLKEDKII